MRGWVWLLGFALACDKSNSSSVGAPASTAPASAETTTSGAGGEAGGSSAPVTAGVATAKAEVAPPDTIIAQHVLVAYRGAKRAPKGVTRTKTEAKTRALEALGKIRGGTPFEDVVKTYSDDQGSVDRMGSLGKFHKGDMDPAFGSAAFALRVGEVSDLVETPFGFHIIKRAQ